jgi:hypothetical protein
MYLSCEKEIREPVQRTNRSIIILINKIEKEFAVVKFAFIFALMNKQFTNKYWWWHTTLPGL